MPLNTVGRRASLGARWDGIDRKETYRLIAALKREGAQRVEAALGLAVASALAKGSVAQPCHETSPTTQTGPENEQNSQFLDW